MELTKTAPASAAAQGSFSVWDWLLKVWLVLTPRGPDARSPSQYPIPSFPAETVGFNTGFRLKSGMTEVAGFATGV